MEIGYAGNSDAYISDDHRFFLFLQSTDSHRYLPLDEYSFISEYGREENCQAMREFLCEHGRRLCAANAVERLGVL
jgi:negative regulator of genetic competence, sporulation and motility